MQPGEVDQLGRHVDAAALGAYCGQRFAEQTAAAADVERTLAVQAAGTLLDIAHARWVDLVQRRHLATWVPPARSEAFEVGDLAGVYVGVGLAGAHGRIFCCHSTGRAIAAAR